MGLLGIMRMEIMIFAYVNNFVDILWFIMCVFMIQISLFGCQNVSYFQTLKLFKDVVCVCNLFSPVYHTLLPSF